MKNAVAKKRRKMKREVLRDMLKKNLKGLNKEKSPDKGAPTPSRHTA